MFFNKLFLLVLFFIFSNDGQLFAQQWKLEKDKKGIQVYTRMSTNSPVKEYKAITTVTTTVEELNNLMKDHAGMKNWFVRCLESTRLKKISEDEYYVYFLNDAPWPVEDRDNITHIKFESKPNGTHWVYLTGKPDYIPKKANCVRIPTMSAHWIFEPLGNGQIKVTQQVLADLGGSVPAWLINMAIVDAPYETLTNLKKKLKK